MKLNFDAVVLEAVYQLVRAKGYNRNRRAFMAFGAKVVGDMHKRGELQGRA